jgi:hypothetical protein
MTRKTVLWVGGAVVALLLAVLWHRQQPPGRPAIGPAANVKAAKPKPVPAAKSMQIQVTKTFAIPPDGTVPVPRRFQLPGVERVRTASSFNEWVAQFPPDAQKAITAFNARHFGVFSINSPQQVAWMAQMGYPMPEDIVAAKFLSDQDLRTLASQGNDKAGFLLHERETDTLQAKYAELAAQGQTRDQFWRNDPAAAQFNQDDVQYNQLLMNSTSPFKGFVKAQDAVLDEDPQYAPATVISSLLWAESFGDFRVDQFVENYVGNDPRRWAILYGAQAMSLNAGISLSALRSLGCPGFNVGNMIPGTASPVQ